MEGEVKEIVGEIEGEMLIEPETEDEYEKVGVTEEDKDVEEVKEVLGVGHKERVTEVYVCPEGL
jgi:hypothetical protein